MDEDKCIITLSPQISSIDAICRSLAAKDKKVNYSTIFKLKEKLLELILKANKYIHTYLEICDGTKFERRGVRVSEVMGRLFF